MKASEKILSIIKEFEGYTPVADQLKGDRKGVITGGFGSIQHPDGRPVKVGDKFPMEYAVACLLFEIEKKCKRLNEVIEIYAIHLNQNQFDALASFIYNVGDGKLDFGTTMGDALHSDNVIKIANAFGAYVYGTSYILGIPYKKKLTGLVRRRAMEKKLFLS